LKSPCHVPDAAAGHPQGSPKSPKDRGLGSFADRVRDTPKHSEARSPRCSPSSVSSRNSTGQQRGSKEDEMQLMAEVARLRGDLQRLQSMVSTPRARASALAR
jgi:hypothetical protein